MAKLLYAGFLAMFVSAVYAEFTPVCNTMKVHSLEETRLNYFTNTGSNEYKCDGSTVLVKLGHRSKIPMRFMIQARALDDIHQTNKTVGSWKVSDAGEQTRQCDATNLDNPDTLYQEKRQDYAEVTWIAPICGKNAEPVDFQFHVLFLDEDDGIHSRHSILMSAASEPTVRLPEDSEEAKDEVIVHDTRTEDQRKFDDIKKKNDEIDLENKASEDDWNKQELEDIRLRDEEMHREEMEFEETLKKEEDDRLARIRAEIRDKEEYDRLISEKERVKELEEEVEKKIEEEKKGLYPDNENEIDFDDDKNIKATAGSSQIAGGAACLVLAVLYALL